MLIQVLLRTFCRFKRLQGFNVFFNCTDEHGQKIQRAAKENNKEPQVFCDEISKTFLICQTLNLSNDDLFELQKNVTNLLLHIFGIF